jgi:hypothetical protein
VREGSFPAARVPFIEHLTEDGNTREGFLEPAEFSKVLEAVPDVPAATQEM